MGLSLENYVRADSTARFVDLFVDSLNLSTFGFDRLVFSQEGRPAYCCSTLLKLLIYGYQQKTRSSRGLSFLSYDSIEVLWLTNCLTPSATIILEFQRANKACISKVFSSFVRFVRASGLISGSEISIDSTKLRAQNSLENNYNEDKLLKKIAFQERKVALYMEELELELQRAANSEVPADDANTSSVVPSCELDSAANSEVPADVPPIEIPAADIPTADTCPASDCEAVICATSVEIAAQVELSVLDKLVRQRVLLAQTKSLLDKLLEATSLNASCLQISTTDPDARLLYFKRNEKAVGYNFQVGVDTLHSLIVGFETTNVSDHQALYGIAKVCKDNLGVDSLSALADAGYHTASELGHCAAANITTFVASGESGSRKPKGFRKHDFVYDEKKDTYTCPAGECLNLKGKITVHHDKKSGRPSEVKDRHWIAKSVCTGCKFRDVCIGSGTKGYREIHRGKHENLVEQNDKRVADNPATYAKRKACSEHPFGIIKRNWDMTYVLHRGIEKVQASFAFTAVAYNLKRIAKIWGLEKFRAAIEKAKAAFCTQKDAFRRLIRPLCEGFAKIRCSTSAFLEPRYARL